MRNLGMKDLEGRLRNVSGVSGEVRSWRHLFNVSREGMLQHSFLATLFNVKVPDDIPYRGYRGLFLNRPLTTLLHDVFR